MLFRIESAKENVNSGGRLNDRHGRHDGRRRPASRRCRRHRRRGDRHGGHFLRGMQAIAGVGPWDNIRLR